MLPLFLLSVISASGNLSFWQGQYYTGTTFHQGNFDFNFSVYDAHSGGNICYTNITKITTGAFGEWKTEQYGVGEACDNSSIDYFLEIKINNETQGDRRILTVWNYLRKDTAGTIKGPVTFDNFLYGTNDLQIGGGEIHHHVNKSGFIRQVFHNVNSNSDTAVIYTLENDVGHQFSIALTSSNYNLTQQFTGENRSNLATISQNAPNSMQFLNRWGYPFIWRVAFNGNLTPQTEIMKLESNGNLSVMGNTTADYFIGDGRYLTGVLKEVFYPAETSSSMGNFRVRSVAAGGAFNFDFAVPDDFSSLESISAVGIIAATGTSGTGKDIDITSSCGQVGELYTADVTSDTSSTYTISAINTIWQLNASNVFGSLSAGDFCGLNIDHNTIGGAIDYLGIKLRYRT